MGVETRNFVEQFAVPYYTFPRTPLLPKIIRRLKQEAQEKATAHRDLTACSKEEDFQRSVAASKTNVARSACF